MDSAHAAPGGYRFYTARFEILLPRSPTVGVTGKGGIWREKPPDAESAVGTATPKVQANAGTCLAQAVLGGIAHESLFCKMLLPLNLTRNSNYMLNKARRFCFGNKEMCQTKTR